MASSGDDQYEEYIKKISKTTKGKVKKQARKALNVFQKAKILNPVLNDEAAYDGIMSWASLREINILNSDLSGDHKIAAIKRIVDGGNYSVLTQTTIADIINNLLLGENTELFIQRLWYG